MSADTPGAGRPGRSSRREFIAGAGGAVGASLLAPLAAAGAAASGAGAAGAAVPYPPALQGLRGNHEGSYTYPHQLRDGQYSTPAARETGERYDLVVVGAGISGLSAAHYYRRRFGARSRILLLDNHDDFGGHARRNEFTVDGRTVLSYGGVQNIDNPSTYSAVAMGLLRDLGIRVELLPRNYDSKLYQGLGTGCFFDAETFGSDRLVAGMGTRPWPEFLAASPLGERQRADIARLYGDPRDYLAGLDREARLQLLAKTSYADYLTRHCGVDPSTLAFFQSYTHDLFGVGIDAVSALTCHRNPDDYESFTYPGFDGLGLEPPEKEPYLYHFPDGNATIARLLVRGLIPESIPSAGVAGIVTARAHYDRLDRAGSRVRLRLSSPVVHVRSAAGGVEVDYAGNGGQAERVSARHCVLACNHGMIPYICPELPAGQKEALHYGVKAPFLYTRVALRNWRAFANLGVRQVVAPGAYHSYTGLDMPVSMGSYGFAHDPDGPMVLFMLRAPCSPGLPMREQYRVGRAELLATTYDTIESKVRDQLQRMLGAGGFDAQRDIAGLTVNRWAHGYAYEYESLWDPQWPPGQAPNQLARQHRGPIAIANADAAARAYTDAAIDEAHRAVGELPA